jgi:ssDNA-binding Zn-finger/Zn-ribbon topoisomerase 1
MNCKKCNSEMDLIDSNEILGYWIYACSNEECDCIANIDDKNDFIEWEEE